MIKIVHSSDFPAPTRKAVWAQVEWLFDRQTEMVINKDTAANFINAKKHFLDYLKSDATQAALRNGYSVNQQFDEYTLLRFKQYIDDLPFSSSHTNTILSAVRKTLRNAVSNQWIAPIPFIEYVLDPASRETDARLPYTERETAQIVKALNEEIRVVQRLLSEYERTGLGAEPTPVPDGTGGWRYPRGWWNSEENMRWYFENKLDCVPITGTDPAVRKTHASFLREATNRYGGLHHLYERWGVSAWIGPETILPYLYKLVAETGLNPTVAMALKLDDYVPEHPLTGRPYIRYWKERGGGEGELHLPLIENGILVLDEQQNIHVKRIWEEVVSLTASFRRDLSRHNEERLFVYQSRGVKTTGDARSFLDDAKTTGLWAKWFVEKYSIQDDSGKAVRLTLARFRPSLVSRLIKRGIDIHVIKSILGHASILTTLRYIESHDFNPHARKEVEKALCNIRENRRQQIENPKPIAESDFVTEKVVFTTGLALCKNVFDPPENIRKASGILPGSPCSLFNMCLRCPNVLILEEHLPRLFALRRQYLAALESGLSASTHRAAIQQNLYVLNGMLDPDRSDWPANILEEAERRSEFLDVVSDPVAIRGVAQ